MDYQDDPDWDTFIRHGVLPSSQNRPDISQAHELSLSPVGPVTTEAFWRGITALEFEKWDNTLPLNDRQESRVAARHA